MTEDLKISIEALYRTFSRYPISSTMDGCPCCVSAKDKEEIHTKPLRQLDGDDLSKYAFKAMTTWGDTDDFKHYLPRIFELLSTTDFVVDTFVVLGKLDYGKWTTWATEEQKVIKDFLLAWWTSLTENKSNFDKEAFVEIYKLLGDITPLLDSWVISFDDNSFKNLIDFLDSYDHVWITQWIDRGAIAKLVVWLEDKKGIIENGFFHYEIIDKEFAQKISNALYVIDRAT